MLRSRAPVIWCTASQRTNRRTILIIPWKPHTRSCSWFLASRLSTFRIQLCSASARIRHLAVKTYNWRRPDFFFGCRFGKLLSVLFLRRHLSSKRWLQAFKYQRRRTVSRTNAAFRIQFNTASRCDEAEPQKTAAAGASFRSSVIATTAPNEAAATAAPGRRRATPLQPSPKHWQYVILKLAVPILLLHSDLSGSLPAVEQPRTTRESPSTANTNNQRAIIYHHTKSLTHLQVAATAYMMYHFDSRKDAFRPTGKTSQLIQNWKVGKTFNWRLNSLVLCIRAVRFFSTRTIMFRVACHRRVELMHSTTWLLSYWSCTRHRTPQFIHQSFSRYDQVQLP